MELGARSPDSESVPPDGRPYREQPQWRNDFPIDWPQDELVERREFTKFLTLTSLAFVVGQAWIAVENWRRRRRGEPPAARIAGAEELPVGGALVFAWPGEQDRCVLVRTGADEFVAFDQRCTHLSCAVVPDAAAGRFHCPCHNGVFDLRTGAPLAGPPRRPLDRIVVERRRVGGVDALFAVGREVRG